MHIISSCDLETQPLPALLTHLPEGCAYIWEVKSPDSVGVNEEESGKSIPYGSKKTETSSMSYKLTVFFLQYIKGLY